MFTDLHELAVPDLAAQIWRGAYFTAAAWVLGQMLEFIRWPTGPVSRRWLMAALGLVVAKTVFVNVLRWEDAIYWEGLPVNTAALVLAWVGLHRWKREPGGPLDVRSRA